MRLKNILLSAAFAAGTAMAAPTSFAATINSGIAAGGPLDSFDGPNQHLYQILGGIGATSLSDPNTINSQQLTGDQYWSIQGSGTSISTMFFEISANSGTTNFGVYDRNAPSNRVNLWGGSATPGTTVALQISDTGAVHVVNLDTFDEANGNFGSGNNFGYYITLADGTTYFSDETLNPGGADQMVAFQGNGSDVLNINGHSGKWGVDEYILGWEDILTPGGDSDYNDLIVLVESVNPVPEPATLTLLGMGLLGLGAVRRRMSKKA